MRTQCLNIASFLGLTLVPIFARAQSVNGTLISFIPVSDGMVFAADSRVTVPGVGYCDGLDKIHPLGKRPFSLFAISGVDTYRSGAKTKEACAFTKSGTIQVDFREIARNYLESQKGPITPEKLKELENVLRTNAQKLARVHPDVMDEDGNVLGFAYGEYNPQQKTISYAAFKVGTGKTMAGSLFFTTIQPDQPLYPQLQTMGKTECFAEALKGRQRLGPNAFEMLLNEIAKRSPTVGQTTHQDALDLANDTIGWTAKYSELHPELKCRIGGPIKVFLIDERHPHGFRLQ